MNEGASPRNLVEPVWLVRLSPHSSPASGLATCLTHCGVCPVPPPPASSRCAPLTVPGRLPLLLRGLLFRFFFIPVEPMLIYLFPRRAGHLPGAPRGSNFSRSPVWPQSPEWGRRSTDIQRDILNPFRGEEADLMPALQTPPYAAP